MAAPEVSPHSDGLRTTAISAAMAPAVLPVATPRARSAAYVLVPAPEEWPWPRMRPAATRLPGMAPVARPSVVWRLAQRRPAALSWEAVTAAAMAVWPLAAKVSRPTGRAATADSR